MGLGDYYAKLIRDADEGIGIGNLLVTNLAALLCWVREPLSEQTLATLLDMMMPDSPGLREGLAAFLRGGHVLLRCSADVSGSPGYALYHDAVRLYLRDSVAMNVPRGQALNKLLQWCSQWREHTSHYALRHYAAHLRETKRVKELYELVRDEDFLDAQASSFYDEPRLPLETLHMALDTAIDHQNLPEIVEFCYACARQRGNIVRDSALDEVCNVPIAAESEQLQRMLGQQEQTTGRTRKPFEEWSSDRAERRARELISQVADVNDQLIWFLILAVEYVERRDHRRARLLSGDSGRLCSRSSLLGSSALRPRAICTASRVTRHRDSKEPSTAKTRCQYQRRLCILLARCEMPNAAAEVFGQITVESEALLRPPRIYQGARWKWELSRCVEAGRCFAENRRSRTPGTRSSCGRYCRSLRKARQFQIAWKIADEFPNFSWHQARSSSHRALAMEITTLPVRKDRKKC